MTFFSLFILISIALVAAQLDSVQRAALLEVLDATGGSSLSDREAVF